MLRAARRLAQQPGKWYLGIVPTTTWYGAKGPWDLNPSLLGLYPMEFLASFTLHFEIDI